MAKTYMNDRPELQLTGRPAVYTLTDAPRNLVFILDLQGKFMKRVGTDRRGNGSGKLMYPTQIAVSHRGIVVLDAEEVAH